MRIFSTKVLAFNHPNNHKEEVIVDALAFSTVPDWVKKSYMFQLALKDKAIEVIESAQSAAKIEKNDGKTDAEVKAAKELAELTEKFQANLAAAKDKGAADKIIAAAAKKGITLKTPEK